MKLNHTKRMELLHLLSLNAYNGKYYSLAILRLMRSAIDKKGTGDTRADCVRDIDEAMGYEAFICQSRNRFSLSWQFVCDLLPVNFSIRRLK